MNLLQTIEKAKKIAIDVGEFIRQESQNFTVDKVELKGKADLVSYVDQTAETRLVEQLSELIPGSSFITEENMVEQKQSDNTWIIDPLDGTTNFVHGIPSYAVSVALQVDGKLSAGIVYEISRDECFWAVKGLGAFRNREMIHVTPANKIDDSLFSTGFPIYNFEKIDEYLAILNELMRNSHGLRRIGSAATDLAFVACGRMEGFFEYNLNAWDVAAGALIVQEAGGTVTDFKGGDDFLFGREIVAAGPVHSELLSVIQKFW